jgi:ABC-type sugar transport system substrate-binding protein
MKLIQILRYLTLVLLILLFGIQSTAIAQKKRIVFFHPTSENNTYWPQVVKVLRAVAEDLDFVIIPYAFDVGDRFAREFKGVQILKKMPKPDAAIFCVSYGNTEPLLQAVETLDIPVFIQGPLFPSELPDVGYSPRKKFKKWIGYFYQDETEKGYILGKTLLTAAREANAFAKDSNIHVVGVGGDSTWFGSQLRKDGLVRAVDEDPEAKLLQVVSTKWTPVEGKKKATLLLKRYPEVSVVWAASDQLGLGASEAIEDSGRILGKTGFVGGLDLSMLGLQSVKKQRLVATVASSMLAYAEIAVYLHDYIHGIDFANDVGTEISTKIYTGTKASADLHLLLSDSYDTVDFKKLSKVYNKKIIKYDFSLEHLPKQ